MSLLSRVHLHAPSFPQILAVSAALRVALIFYSEWHDAHSIVKYTDIDYLVFSDAAQFVLNPSVADGNTAKGPWGYLLNLGDPYTRQTYRYTPLLALLLTPNGWLHPSFGKYLFAACDLLNGILIHKLLVTMIIPGLSRRSATGEKTPDASTPSSERDGSSRATLLAALHLLNPLVFTISTRGSSESILTSLVLLTLFFALKGRWDAAAVLLGLSTHWKAFPFIYGVGCLGVIGGGGGQGSGSWIGTVVNWRTIRFGLISAGTFVLLGAGCYAIWGYPFLFESYLYHVHRLDHRHNFSPYFYLTYLTYPSSLVEPPAPILPFLRSPLISFVPQMALALGTGLMFGRRKEDLVFTWFVQTAAFVLFNKVCTSQYFLWYLPLLPLLIPRLSISTTRATCLLLVWVGTQALWLAEAYKLEFLGADVFYGLWVRSLVYVAGGAWVLGGIMSGYGKAVQE
ncbi:glycosyltransferase family 50 protein [Athelia psychrophila]|uniref:GPI mannosyltransferase 1 n=1 Tax=Athelia psychrophila TaxID=1759441 RepID=A0A166BER1_9AGAM|nr:glycosyltransferase family 50 protein [Fibularhizoctonia sp. CBS 109695]